MIKARLKSHSLLGICLAAVLGCTGNQDSTAAGTNPWKQEIQCGNTRYQITSECVASGSDMELNTCKQQTLTQLDIHKTIALPNPTKADAKGIAKAGNTGSLFATIWSCVALGQRQFLQVYYSTGGRHGEYEELLEFYDEKLTPLHKTDKKLADALSKARQYRKKTVQSIMPLEEKVR